MRRSTQKIAPIFVVLLALALAFPGLFGSYRNQVSAFAQDTSRSDALFRAKRTTPRIVQGVAATNDNCANAIAITSCPFTSNTSNAGATRETGEPQPCGSIGATLWYTYTTGSKSVQVNASTCNSAPTDTVLAVYKVNGAACDFANFAPVSCNDDAGCGDGFQSQVGFIAQPNSTYKIQVGGFSGDMGNIILDVTCAELNCDPININGTLGSGAPGFTGTQFSGLQTGRLNRNGVASSCAAAKTCQIFDPTGLRAFDAYQIPNQSGQNACVTISLNAPANTACNMQSNAYLNTYNPSSICTGYLGDPGLSLGVPPTPTNFSVVVPANQTLIVVVHTTNPGETGCPYTLTLVGDLCAGFNACVQDDQTPGRFILVNTTTGKYEYHDCAKGIVLRGTGEVSPAGPPSNCKFQLFDSGPDPKRPDRSVFVEINVCTFVSSASISSAFGSASLADSNYTNNNCACPR
ncbi:MAG: hypothetical protein ACJ74J_02285 [Blastocatellia bacterium]